MLALPCDQLPAPNVFGPRSSVVEVVVVVVVPSVRAGADGSRGPVICAARLQAAEARIRVRVAAVKSRRVRIGYSL